MSPVDPDTNSSTNPDTNSSKDFNTLSNASNNSPLGIWSDGQTMWVSDDRDDKLCAYDLETKVIVP